MTRTIGEAIEGRLHEMKIKPEELATVLDVPLPTLSGWLWLKNDIPAQYILKIAHVLRCTPTYLLSGGEDDRETPTKSDAIEDLIRATVAEVLRQQEAQKRRFIHLTAKLDALSPLKVLARGYSVVLTEEGRVVQRAEQVSVGQQVTVKLSEGSITASVLGTQEERHG